MTYECRAAVLQTLAAAADEALICLRLLGEVGVTIAACCGAALLIPALNRRAARQQRHAAHRRPDAWVGVGISIRDERHDGSSLEVTFQGELRPEQKTAADAILREETGVLVATTAFGKTVVAAWLIARRGVNALVLVHRRQLLDQWIERLSTLLDIPAKSKCNRGVPRPTTGHADGDQWTLPSQRSAAHPVRRLWNP